MSMKQNFNKKVTVYPLIGQPDKPVVTELSKIITYIKQGRWSKQVHKVAAVANDKSLKNELKATLLPVVCFNGQFDTRSKEGLLKANGLMIVDYDGFEDDVAMEAFIESRKDQPEIFVMFKSPSYKGVKAIIRIPVIAIEDKEIYTQYYKAFNDKWPSHYWDKSCTDISRACYVSSDPDLYSNEDAIVFKPDLTELKEEEETVIYENDLPEEEIYQRVKSFNRETSYKPGQKNDFIVSLAGHCCEYGVSEAYAIERILADFVISVKECEENKVRIKSVYKRRVANSASFDFVAPEAPPIESDDFVDFPFHKLELVPKTNPPRFIILIEAGPLFAFLTLNGFYKLYRTDDGDPVFVHSVDNVVSLSSAARIKDFILEYVKLVDLGDNLIEGPNLYEKIILGSNYNNPKFFNALVNIDIDPLLGDLTKDYLFFSNGILVITKDATELMTYKDADKMVWKSSIQNRSFIPVVNHTNDFQKFISNVTKNEPEKLESAIGFLLSSYKNKAEAKAIILNDKVVDDDPQGGSGKDLLLQAIAQHREVVILNGKSWKPSDTFALQGVTEATHLLILEDAAERVKFEDLFPLITGQVHVNAKNKAAFDIPFHLAPKFAVTTNYVVQGTSESHKRRKVDYELEKVYGSDYTPYDEFGKQFFDDEDWDAMMWNNFDNYAVHCLQIYLTKGIIKPEISNIAYKQLIAASCDSFAEWAEFHLADVGKFYSNDLRFEYLKCYNIPERGDFDKEALSAKKFSIWTREFAHYKSWTRHSDRVKVRGFYFLNKAEFIAKES